MHSYLRCQELSVLTSSISQLFSWLYQIIDADQRLSGTCAEGFCFTAAFLHFFPAFCKVFHFGGYKNTQIVESNTAKTPIIVKLCPTSDGLLHVRLFVAQVYMKQRWCDGIKKKHHCLRITYVSVNIVLISFQ